MVNEGLNATLEVAKEDFSLPTYKKARFDRLTWAALKKSHYGNIEMLTERMASLELTFNLTPLDFAQFDMYSRIYVKQLGAYYLPVYVTYQAGEFAKVKMLKITPNWEG